MQLERQRAELHARDRGRNKRAAQLEKQARQHAETELVSQKRHKQGGEQLLQFEQDKAQRNEPSDMYKKIMLSEQTHT